MAYDFVSASSQSITANLSTTMPFTLFIKGRPSQTNVLNSALGIHQNTGFTPRLYAGYNSTALTVLYVEQNGAIFSQLDGVTTYSANTWSDVLGIVGSSTDRKFYFNGNLEVSSTTPTVDVGMSLNEVVIGARRNGASTGFGLFFNGRLSEAAIWNVALTDDEITSLSKGFKPYRIRPQSLVFYAPLIRDLQDVKAGLALTNNNSATVTDHPRVY